MNAVTVTGLVVGFFLALMFPPVREWFASLNTLAVLLMLLVLPFIVRLIEK